MITITKIAQSSVTKLNVTESGIFPVIPTICTIG